MNYTFKNQILGQSDFCNNNSALLRQSFSVSRLFKTMCNTLSVSQIHDFNLWQQLGSRKVDIPQTIVEQCALVCKCIQSIGCGLIFHFLTPYFLFHFHFLIPQTIVEQCALVQMHPVNCKCKRESKPRVKWLWINLSLSLSHCLFSFHTNKIQILYNLTFKYIVKRNSSLFERKNDFSMLISSSLKRGPD